MRRFNGPLYDLSRLALNREPKKLYRRGGTRVTPTAAEQGVVEDLKVDGIAVRRLSDLLPAALLTEAQEWAEGLVSAPSAQERINYVEGGEKPADAKSGKYYIVRLLGDRPVIDVDAPVMRMSLSDAVLRIVGAYFGMLPRLAAIDLWYNVATKGPDVASQRWHRDPEDKQIVKTFLYLRDVDKTNGPFCFVRGSHNGGPFKGVRPQALAATNYPEDGFVESAFPADRVRVCLGEAGTLVFCDTTGFHRGGHPTGAARLVFNGVYTTNAGVPIVAKMRQFSLVDAPPARSLSEQAAYAIGHLSNGVD